MICLTVLLWHMSIMDRQTYRQTDIQTDRQHNTCIQCAVPHKRHLHQLTEVNKESSVTLPLVMRKCHYARQIVLLSAELLLHSRMQAIHNSHVNTESKYERRQHAANIRVDAMDCLKSRNLYATRYSFHRLFFETN